MRNLIKPSVIHQPEFCFLMFFVCFSVVMEDVLFFFLNSWWRKIHLRWRTVAVMACAKRWILAAVVGWPNLGWVLWYLTDLYSNLGKDRKVDDDYILVGIYQILSFLAGTLILLLSQLMVCNSIIGACHDPFVLLDSSMFCRSNGNLSMDKTTVLGTGYPLDGPWLHDFADLRNVNILDLEPVIWDWEEMRCCSFRCLWDTEFNWMQHRMVYQFIIVFPCVSYQHGHRMVIKWP